MLTRKEHGQNVKAIRGELQQTQVVEDVDKTKKWVVRKTSLEKRNITLIKDKEVRKRYDEKVTIS